MSGISFIIATVNLKIAILFYPKRLLSTYQNRSFLLSFLSLLSSLGARHCHSSDVHGSHQRSALYGNTLDKRNYRTLLACRHMKMNQQIVFQCNIYFRLDKRFNHDYEIRKWVTDGYWSGIAKNELGFSLLLCLLILHHRSEQNSVIFNELF